MDVKGEPQRGRWLLGKVAAGKCLEEVWGDQWYMRGPSCESLALSLQIFLKVVEDTHREGAS